MKVASLIVAMLIITLALCACNTYPNVLKAFEAEGYTESSAAQAVADSIKASLEKDEVAVNIHVLYNITKGTAIIIEFKATSAMKEEINNNDELKQQIKNFAEDPDAQDLYKQLTDAGIVNGNCVLIPIALTESKINAIIEIFKKA